VPRVTAATFSPDSTLIVTGGACPTPTRCDPTVRTWDVTTGRPISELHGHTAGVNSAAFSPDGKYVVSASDDGTVRLWELNTGENIAQIRGYETGVQQAIFSLDGGMIATRSYDRNARIWIPPTSPLRFNAEGDSFVLRGHADPLSSVAFSPDGKLVVTGSWDGTGRVWDVAGQRERVARLRSVGELLALAQTCVGRSLTDEEKKRFLSH
jgi:WD40 repeat protein